MAEKIEKLYSHSDINKTYKGEKSMTMDTKQTQTPLAHNGGEAKSNSLWKGISAALLIVVLVASTAWYKISQEFDGEFSTSTSSFSLDLLKNVPLNFNSNVFKFVKEGDVVGLQITGTNNLFGSVRMTVDTKKTYAMKVRLKVLKDDAAKVGTWVYAGFATFDKDGKLQHDQPGSHRYFAGRELVRSNDGWRELFGVITGEGNENYNQFRNGTQLATPVLLANYDSPDAVILVDYIRLTECSSTENCQTEIDQK